MKEFAIGALIILALFQYNANQELSKKAKSLEALTASQEEEISNRNKYLWSSLSPLIFVCVYAKRAKGTFEQKGEKSGSVPSDRKNRGILQICLHEEKEINYGGTVLKWIFSTKKHETT